MGRKSFCIGLVSQDALASLAAHNMGVHTLFFIIKLEFFIQHEGGYAYFLKNYITSF